uniref:Uncharacterized protein n=1 Tax=Anguilla anguilla TaxID=7936 RepID=A0A0E9U9V5_ANGAN
MQPKDITTTSLHIPSGTYETITSSPFQIHFVDLLHFKKELALKKTSNCDNHMKAQGNK